MIGIKDIFALLGRFVLPAQQVKTKRRASGAALLNPVERFQAQRIEAAADKRERREEKRRKNAILSFLHNKAHRQSNCFDSLNPTYVAK